MVRWVWVEDCGYCGGVLDSRLRGNDGVGRMGRGRRLGDRFAQFRFGSLLIPDAMMKTLNCTKHLRYPRLTLKRRSMLGTRPCIARLDMGTA